jgi:uncharacterized protein (TIRG00374 family)
MGEKRRRQRIKMVLTIATMLALFGLAYAVRHQLSDTLSNLSRVNIWAVLLVIPFEALNYHAQAKLYQGFFRILGHKLKYKFMYRIALEMNFVNNIFPSAGVSGFSYISVRMRSRDVPAAASTIVQMMKFILVFVAFQVYLFVGLLFLAIGGKASNLLILIAGSLATLLLVATLLIAYVIGSKNRINSFFTLVTKMVNRLIQIFRPAHPETINITRAREVFNDLHENYMHVRRNLGALRTPFVYALLANLTEVLAIYTVYVAFGHWVNPGAVIIAYAVANFAGLISVLPGGVGIYEALMTGIMAAGGVSAAVSIPVTIMYRVVNMLVQLPPGYYFYQKALHEVSGEPALTNE